MTALLVIVGVIVGGWLAGIDEVMLGFGAGAFAGYLLARNIRLSERVRTLEQQALESRSPAASPRPVEAQRSIPAATVSVAGADDDAVKEEPRVTPRPAESQAASDDREAPPREGARETPLTPLEDWLARAWNAGKRWITTGNVPVKVGVIVLFFGVAFLLRYAVERELLVVPVELRLLGVAAIAVVLLAVGWRLRRSQRVYALSLQGGGIGILYLTIFAAFRLYALLPATLAFLLLVVLTAAAGVLAIRQDAKALAVLGIVGGFLAPVLVSTGQGSHVALFSYYLLLNAAILGISWFRAWRELNLIGFAFTFGIGTLWGIQYYQPALYASTQPFLVLYFLFYQGIAILFAHRQAPRLRGLVDGTVLFGTPVIAFALQQRLVADTEYGLALSAAAAGVFYAGVASFLFRRHRATLRLLVESYVALGVAFATIAIPLALDARWTAAAWALEGAALCWVGIRQHGLLAKAAGAVLLFLSGLSFLDGGWFNDRGMPVINGNLLGGLLIAASALFAAYRFGRDERPHPLQKPVAAVLLLWGLLFGLGSGWREVLDRADSGQFAALALLYTAAAFAALDWAARRLDWSQARPATMLALPLFVLLGLVSLIEPGHFFAAWGWLAWPIAAVVHLRLLRAHDGILPRVESAWHTTGLLLISAGVAREFQFRLDAWAFNGTWQDGAALAAAAVIAWTVLENRNRIAWPVQHYATAYLNAVGITVLSLLVAFTVLCIDVPGDPAPLPYVPLLNPFDALLVLILTLAWRYLALAETGHAVPGLPRATLARPLWIGIAFVLTTIAVVRAVHHVVGVPWNSALAGSVSVQAALSIYWGMLGFAGMVLGAKRSERTVWLVGTAMMALVVAKLFLVDLGNTGTVARIVSFIGVGALLLVVGYFAPAPPRVHRNESPAEDS